MRSLVVVRGLAALLAACLMSEGHAREAHGATGLPAEPWLEAELTATMGQARTPFPSPDAREISGLLTTFSVAAAGLVTPTLSVSLRLPLVLADVYLPAGGAHSTTSFGHPEGALFWRVLQQGALAATVGVGVAAPVGGDAAVGRRPFENQALLLASAQFGWRDRELFAPGRLGLTPSAHLSYRAPRFIAFAHLELPFLIAVKRGSPDERVDVHSVASTAALAVGATAWWRDRLSLTVAPWVVADLLPTEELRMPATSEPNSPSSPARWTLSLLTALRIHIKGPLTAEVGSTILLAGALHGLPSLALGLAAAW